MYAISVNPTSGLPTSLLVARLVSHAYASLAYASSECLYMWLIKYSLNTHTMSLTLFLKVHLSSPLAVYLIGDIDVKYVGRPYSEVQSLCHRLWVPAYWTGARSVSSIRTLWIWNGLHLSSLRHSRFLILHPHIASQCVEEPSVRCSLWDTWLVRNRCHAMLKSVGATMGNRAHGSWRCSHFICSDWVWVPLLLTRDASVT